MTNYNRTYGDFAAGEALDFMVLNRRYEVGSDNTIKDLTTYIDPQKHIEIFADTPIYRDWETDRKSTRLNSSHSGESRMPSSA